MRRLYREPDFPWFRALLFAIIGPLPIVAVGVMFFAPDARGIVLTYFLVFAIFLVGIVLEGFNFWGD